jgi:Ser/Thr protein kinase RdoA (MazF antagonist)
VQRALVGERHTLTNAGLPDFTPSTVAARFARLIERFAGLPSGHPSHISAELAGRLEGAMPQLVEAAERVAQSPIPSTFQHGDVHPWNVSIDAAGRVRSFDFGDAQWAFALESLSVPYGWIAGLTTIPWEPVRDAYFDHWSDLVTSREFDALWQASTLLHAVNRTATWWAALQGASAAEWVEWGAAPLAQLCNVLEGPR